MKTVQREFEVTLPIGYADDKGQVHRKAVIRKIRGHEEALMSDPSLSAGQLVTELIRSCLIQLGDLESVTPGVVAELYSADRNYLLLELRRITLGNELRQSYLCPRCQSEVVTIEDLSQLPVARLSDGEVLSDTEVNLDDGYVDRNGATHMELTLRLPRGVDEEFVSRFAAKDPLRAQDALVLRCIKRIGALPKAELEAYGIKILRDLTLGDRWKLQRALFEDVPGVRFERRVECSQCGTTFDSIMDLSDFFVMS